ncbi:hypothetical protein LguiA_005386 [Lonicera macranthoides]
MVRRIEIEGLGEMREVSQAQEALVRVFKRVLEMEGTQEVRRKISGAQVRVLPRELLLACAFPTDELIQVGGVVLRFDFSFGSRESRT